MTEIRLTPPIFDADGVFQFSAYQFTWGYRSVTLFADVVRSGLGARDGSPEQLMLAFRLNSQRIARAIEHLSPRADGRPQVIGLADL